MTIRLSTGLKDILQLGGFYFFTAYLFYNSKTKTFVYEDDNVIKGAVSITDNKISNLYVKIDCRGLGIGTELLSYAEQEIFKKYTCLYVLCADDLTPYYIGKNYTKLKIELGMLLLIKTKGVEI